MTPIRGRGPKAKLPRASTFVLRKRLRYPTLLGQPKTSAITLKAVSLKSGSQVFLLGNDKPLVWSQPGNDVKIRLPAAVPGQYAHVFRMEG